MRRLLLLLSVLLVISVLSSPCVLAASKPIQYRFHSIVALLCQNLFPISGIYFVPEEIILVNDGTETRVGGDADDYANGKTIPGPDEQKPNGGKLEGSSVEPKGLTRGSISAVR